MELRPKHLGLTVMILLFGFVNLSPAQQARSALRMAAATKADISQMDWLLLRAQVDNLANFSSSPPHLHHLAYDAATDRIVVVAIADPDWLASAKAETLKEKLQTIAIAHCVSVFLFNKATAGWSSEEQLRHCYAELMTWDKKGEFRTAAVYENSEVKLR